MLARTRQRVEKMLREAEIDPDILALVAAMNADDLITTMGSCSGHGKASANVEIAVRGMEACERSSRPSTRSI